MEINIGRRIWRGQEEKIQNKKNVVSQEQKLWRGIVENRLGAQLKSFVAFAGALVDVDKLWRFSTSRFAGAIIKFVILGNIRYTNRVFLQIAQVARLVIKRNDHKLWPWRFLLNKSCFYY